MNLKKIFAPVVCANILAMCLFVALVIAGFWYGTKVYTRHGEVIQVPDVTRMHHSNAALLLLAGEM